MLKFGGHKADEPQVASSGFQKVVVFKAVIWTWNFRTFVVCHRATWCQTIELSKNLEAGVASVDKSSTDKSSTVLSWLFVECIVWMGNDGNASPSKRGFGKIHDTIESEMCCEGWMSRWFWTVNFCWIFWADRTKKAQHLWQMTCYPPILPSFQEFLSKIPKFWHHFSGSWVVFVKNPTKNPALGP